MKPITMLSIPISSSSWRAPLILSTSPAAGAKQRPAISGPAACKRDLSRISFYELTSWYSNLSSKMAESSSSPSDAAVKQRIIKHMNHDHQDSIRRYLEHYAHLSSFFTRNATLTDISFSAMEIRIPPFLGLGSGTYHTVPIKPKLESWADARPRAVAMDHEAIAALERSPVTVKSYVAPHGFMLVVFIACVLTNISFCSRKNFIPGSLFYRNLRLDVVPGFAKFCYYIQPLIISIMVGLHAVEAWWIASGRLKKHSVPVGSPLWFRWVGSTSVEGVGAMIRFDRLVREEEEKRAKAKH